MSNEIEQLRAEVERLRAENSKKDARIAELDDSNEHHRELARISRDAELKAVSIAAAQSAALEKAKVALENSRDDVVESIDHLNQMKGYPRYDKQIKEKIQQLSDHDEALAAIEALPSAPKGGA